MQMAYTLGSLFDGSGGFPLAGSLCGIEPVWAAEVEPYPIAVTRSRFPSMKHLGDISKVNGGEIEPVDIITFGSPCQDLSVAGKRAGLKHEANGDDETTRSGLFMEAVRIIKEMREATNGEYPTFALWENVPGAFSSNKGEDFRIVCEELIKIIEPGASMPEVPKNGWPYADSYIGDGWSLAYRVFDAQYWGVPQRRRRIHLIVDFRGERAREVLFEREGVRGYFAEGRTPWQGIACDAQDCTGADDREGDAGDRGLDAVAFEPGIAAREGGHIYEGVSGTLRANAGDNRQAVAYTLKVRSGVAVDSSGKAAGKGALVQTEKAATLAATQDQYLFQPVPNLLLDDQGGQQISVRTDEKSPTLRAEAHGNVPAVVAYSFDSLASNSMKSSNPHSGCRQVEVAKTLDTTDPNPSKNQGGIAIVEQRLMDAYQHHGWRENDVRGTLTAGQNDTVRGDTPLVCVKTWDARGNGDGETVSTLTGDHENRITDYSSLVCEPIPIHDQATRFFGKRGDKADGKGNGLGVGEPGDPMNTLTAGDRHGVAYLASGKNTVGTLMANAGTKLWLGNQEAFSGDYHIIEERPTVRYIVRRLTPTECARLQGFADRWGDIDEKDSFTDEEFRFWHEVRNTHAAINGKKVQGYTEKQMLAWYNKLHTDSAEYKMWGNGIALPPALYCMQGIMDAFRKAEEDAWML